MSKYGSFEYAVRKDVRNNPIVREVDFERHRELWKSLAVAGFLALVALFSAWQHFELLQHGYALEQMQRQRAVEEEEARLLRLDIETKSALSRIETLAIEQLGLVEPSTNEVEVIVVKRVMPAEPPDETVVARR